MGTIDTVLITGANSGLGFETAAQLAEQGAKKVILGCRSKEKALVAKQKLSERTGKDVFEIEIIDVSEIQSAANAANRLKETGVKIDLLLLNASKDSLERVITNGGFELTLATNVVGHHVLTMELINHGVLSDQARIVMSTSETVRRMFKSKLYPYKEFAQKSDSVSEYAQAMLKGDIPKKHTQPSSYGNAKLWAIWWVSELAKHLPSGMAVFAVSPGVIPETRDPKTYPWLLRYIVYPLFLKIGPKIGQSWSVSEGANQYLTGAQFPVENSGSFLGAPAGKVIGLLEPQTEELYFNAQWSSAVWNSLVKMTGYTIHKG